MRIGIREQLAVVVLVTALLPLAVRVVEKIDLLSLAVCGFLHEPLSKVSRNNPY
jgi:hypothetical protein